jgi:5-methylcytosine-specific restriction endonuclease McrA
VKRGAPMRRKRLQRGRRRINAVSASQRAFQAAYKALRPQILERDGHRCRHCGARAQGGVWLEVHHVAKRSQRKDLRLADDNLITLCAPDRCHALTDRPFQDGRLVIRPLGGGLFDLRIVTAADKWATA